MSVVSNRVPQAERCILERFPVDTLKIDQSLVSGMIGDTDDASALLARRDRFPVAAVRTNTQAITREETVFESAVPGLARQAGIN